MVFGTLDVIVPIVSSAAKPYAVTFPSTSASMPDPWCPCSTTTLSTRKVSGPSRKPHCKFDPGVSTVQQLMGVIRQLTSRLCQSQLRHPPNPARTVRVSHLAGVTLLLTCQTCTADPSTIHLVSCLEFSVPTCVGSLAWWWSAWSPWLFFV